MLLTLNISKPVKLYQFLYNSLLIRIYINLSRSLFETTCQK